MLIMLQKFYSLYYKVSCVSCWYIPDLVEVEGCVETCSIPPLLAMFRFFTRLMSVGFAHLLFSLRVAATYSSSLERNDNETSTTLPKASSPSSGYVNLEIFSPSLELLDIESTTTVGLEVGLQPRTRSIGSNISHFCRWFPGILLPPRILRYFCLRLLILTRHCFALLDYPPSAISWVILSHTSFLLCMVFNSCCTASSLHKAIKSLVSSNHHVSAILFNHAL